MHNSNTVFDAIVSLHQEQKSIFPKDLIDTLGIAEDELMAILDTLYLSGKITAKVRTSKQRHNLGAALEYGFIVPVI